MSLLAQEMDEQPEAAARLLATCLPRLDDLWPGVRRTGLAGLVVAARGSSDNAARYAQYLWGLRLGLPVALAAPSLASVYGRGLDLRGQAVVAVSQSGASPDVVGVVADAGRSGAPTLAVTNDAESPLAEAAAHLLPLDAGPERSVAATKTYTTSLLALALLALALDDQPGEAEDLAALRRVPDALAAALRGTTGVDRAVEVLAPHRRAVCVGRGLNLATAHETALKLTELTGTLVTPFSPADLLHGPVAAVGPDVPVVLLAPEEPASESVLSLLPELTRRQAPVVVVRPADAAPCPDAVEVTLPTDATLPAWLSPVSTVVAGQLLARSLAEARGVDVDRPGELSKVTRTR